MDSTADRAAAHQVFVTRRSRPSSARPAWPDHEPRAVATRLTGDPPVAVNRITWQHLWHYVAGARIATESAANISERYSTYGSPLRWPALQILLMAVGRPPRRGQRGAAFSFQMTVGSVAIINFAIDTDRPGGPPELRPTRPSSHPPHPSSRRPRARGRGALV